MPRPRPPLASLLIVALAAAWAPAARADDAPTQAVVLNGRAVERYEAGDLEEALLLFRQALDLDDHPTIRANAAKCLVRIGDLGLEAREYERAARDYHEAGELTPDAPGPPLREGLALLSAGRLRDAVAVLERAVRLAPNEPRAHRRLGEALYRLGENARAIACWERALALAPDDGELREALAKVRKEEQAEGDLFVDLGAAHFTIKYDGLRDVDLGREVARALEAAYEEVGRLVGRYPRAR